MAEPTQAPSIQNSPRLIAWCNWHDGLSDTARLVEISTAGKRFACERCRIANGLVPLADQP